MSTQITQCSEKASKGSVSTRITQCSEKVRNPCPHTSPSVVRKHGIHIYMHHSVTASKLNNVSMGLEPFFDFVFCMCEHLLLLPEIPLFALNTN